MTRGWVVGLVAAVAAAQFPAQIARAQGGGWGGGAPQGSFDGQWVQAPPAPDGVRVDITADSPNVRLLRVDGGRQIEVCAAPCGVMVPRQGEYQIGGAGVVRTSRFTVPADRPDLQLHVRSGSNGQRWAGIVLGIVGYATCLVGESAASYEHGDSSGPSLQSEKVALGVVLSGLVVGSVGLIMILTANTQVSTSSGVSFSHAAPIGRRTAFRLTPRGLEF